MIKLDDKILMIKKVPYIPIYKYGFVRRNLREPVMQKIGRVKFILQRVFK